MVAVQQTTVAIATAQPAVEREHVFRWQHDGDVLQRTTDHRCSVACATNDEALGRWHVALFNVILVDPDAIASIAD